MENMKENHFEVFISYRRKSGAQDARTLYYVWGIERSGFFNGREKWAKGFENQRV